ncbi:MAG TPA: 50S ribosomal protein L17 [Bacteroidales bacterium]|nr:50S ribosomal protein L17 [Bacteroidales bacterium]
MRHKKSFNHLSRKPAHRKAMLANMAASLILHKRISTTTAKAKALRMYVEPLITKAKDDSTHSRRTVFSYLQNKDAVTELFREVGAKVMSRAGGYTRILKTGTRLGDNADMCIIELVDYNENLLAAKEEKQQKSSARRSRRGGKKSKPAEETTQQTEQPTESEGQEPKTEQKEVEEAKEETKETPEAKAEALETDKKKEEPKEKKVKKETSEEKVDAKKEDKEKKEEKTDEKKD